MDYFKEYLKQREKTVQSYEFQGRHVTLAKGADAECEVRIDMETAENIAKSVRAWAHRFGEL